MVFSNTIFLFIFLPLFLLLYFATPKQLKNTTLLIASIAFYSWGEGTIVLVMLASAGIDFFCGIGIERGWKKTGLAVSLLSNLGLLAFFKYADFAFENYNLLLESLGIAKERYADLPHIALPIGISFYTFQTMSYTIDVYRGQVRANRNFINFATFVTMFPQLVAGPIVRYCDIEQGLASRKSTSLDFAEGTERFIIGLAKKVLIANNFAIVADKLFSLPPDQLAWNWAWAGALAYSIQIYFDFSGYSDMAIGLGRMLGFRFGENFNYPYTARSMQDFWRRWHISLSTWFRDYLYISLGGNRKGRLATYRNLLIVFFLTGLWHGASWNFIAWGLFHGFFLVTERTKIRIVLEKMPCPVQHAYVTAAVVAGWVLFRTETLPDAWAYFSAMLRVSGNSSLSSYLSFHFFNGKYIVLAVAAILFAMPVYAQLDCWSKKTALARLSRQLGISALLAFSLIYIIAGAYNPFIYFRF